MPSLEKDQNHGEFKSLEEAELKLAIAGWKIEKEITRDLPDDAFAERTILKAFGLTSL